MPITVAPRLVEYLETRSGSCEVVVRAATDQPALDEGLRLAANALFQVEHPEEPGEPFASFSQVSSDGEPRLRFDMADAEAYPGVMAATIGIIVRSLTEVGVADGVLTAPGLESWVSSVAAVPAEVPIAALRLSMERKEMVVEISLERDLYGDELHEERSWTVSFLSSTSNCLLSVTTGQEGVAAHFLHVGPTENWVDRQSAQVEVAGATFTVRIPLRKMRWTGGKLTVSADPLARTIWRPEEGGPLVMDLSGAPDHSWLALPPHSTDLASTRDGAGSVIEFHVEQEASEVERFLKQSLADDGWSFIQEERTTRGNKFLRVEDNQMDFERAGETAVVVVRAFFRVDDDEVEQSSESSSVHVFHQPADRG